MTLDASLFPPKKSRSARSPGCAWRPGDLRSTSVLESYRGLARLDGSAHIYELQILLQIANSARWLQRPSRRMRVALTGHHPSGSDTLMQQHHGQRPRRLRHLRGALCTSALLLSLAGSAAAAPSRPLLSLLFQDHAVLQRGRPISVWGWSVPGDEVTVSLETVSRTTHADRTGRWSVSLPPLPAGGPHALDVHARSGASQVIHDVLIGDVWLC